MSITTQQTLAQLVTADPRRARVLEGFGLDYCCGGARTLADASAAADVDPDRVLAALDLPDRPVPYYKGMWGPTSAQPPEGWHDVTLRT